MLYECFMGDGVVDIWFHLSPAKYKLIYFRSLLCHTIPPIGGVPNNGLTKRGSAQITALFQAFNI